jgi:hypothetical protein
MRIIADKPHVCNANAVHGLISSTGRLCKDAPKAYRQMRKEATGQGPTQTRDPADHHSRRDFEEVAQIPACEAFDSIAMHVRVLERVPKLSV